MMSRCFRGRVKARRTLCSMRLIRHKQRPPWGSLPMRSSRRTAPRGLPSSPDLTDGIRASLVLPRKKWLSGAGISGSLGGGGPWSSSQAVRTAAECQEAQGVCWAYCWGRGGAAGVSFLCHRSRDLENWFKRQHPFHSLINLFNGCRPRAYWVPGYSGDSARHGGSVMETAHQWGDGPRSLVTQTWQFVGESRVRPSPWESVW